MKKETKTVIVRHIGEEFPLKINITEQQSIVHPKGRHEISNSITYQFDCTLDNLEYITQSKNDASKAFKELCRKLEEHGYKICCCGTCMHFYLDWTAKNWFGGIHGFCLKVQEPAKPHSKDNIRHLLHDCKNLDLSRDAESEFIREE